MNTYGNLIVMIVAILCVFVNVSESSTFRCGTQLVSIEDTRDEVLHMCGEPTSIEAWEEERIIRDHRTIRDYNPKTGRYEWLKEPFLVKVLVNMELWTYNLGSTKFIRYLRFENGIVTKITTGDKGY